MRLSLRTLCALLLLATSASAQIKISHPPADVKTRTFDANHPPADMPPLRDQEAAVTVSKFACGAQVQVDIVQNPGEKATAKIAGMDVTLRLEITVWLPENASGKIKTHEDGHRKISETFYARGEKVAKELADKYIGRSLAIDGPEPEQTKAVITRAANEYCQEYLGLIEGPSQKAQERYDLLTDHGRNDVPEKNAIKKAMETAGRKSE